MGPKRGLTCLAAILGLAAVLRVPDLRAYPFYARDEGLWTQCVKSYLTLGDWFADDHRHANLAPAYTLVILGAFKAFGIRVVVARVVSVVFSLVAVAALYQLVRRVYGPSVAIACGLLLATDPYGITTWRRAYLEPMAGMLVVVGVLMWVCLSGWRRLGAGVPLGIALATKAMVVLIFPALLVWAVIEAGRRLPWGARTRILGSVVASGLVAVAVAAPLFLFFWAQNPDHFADYWRFHTVGVYVGEQRDFLRDCVWNTCVNQVTRYPVMTVALLVSLWLLRRQRQPADWLFLTWFAAGLLIFLCWRHVSGRHLMLLLPATCALVARGLSVLSHRRRRWLLSAVVFAQLLLLGLHWAHTRDTTPARLETWARTHLQPDDLVVGPSHLGLSLAQVSLESPALELAKPCLPPYRDLIVLFDDIEWRAYDAARGGHMAAQLQAHGNLVARVGHTEVWRLDACPDLPLSGFGGRMGADP